MSSTTNIALDDDDDIYDASFLNELDFLEKSIISSTQHHHHHHPPPQQPPQQPPYKPYTSFATPLPAPPPPTTALRRFPAASISVDSVSYSPPRELSQRFTAASATDAENKDNNNISSNNNNNSSGGGGVGASSCSNSKRSSTVDQSNHVIDVLKSELSRVNKQLSDLKDECSKLREERDEKKQLKVAHPDSKTVSCDDEAPLVVHPKKPPLAERGSMQTKMEQKSVGIQTDKGDESASPSISGTASSFSGRPKLLTIWSSRSSCTLQRKFGAKMLETCAADFCALFGFLGLNLTSETLQECLTHMPLTSNVQNSRSNEVMRVSQLYSVLNKLSNNIVSTNVFVDILLDLCKLENALVVHRSLRILRVAVGYLLSSERIHSKRDNVHVEKCPSGSDNELMHRSDLGKSGVMCDISRDEASSVRFAVDFKNIRTPKLDAMTSIDWFRIFTSMCETAVKMTEEHVKVEAISIMNIIMRGADPYSERGRFGDRCVFVAVADFLKKGVGLFCRKEAIHLVYLLLNCPNLLAAFCSSCKETEGHPVSANDGVEHCSYQTSCAILEGFMDCILRHGHSLKELSLCRNAMLVLAFLASSGKSGLDIFLFHKLSNGVNFLGLILKVLVSEIDAEALESYPAPEISRERTLLMREVLILLNRLVSHPASATSVLRVLTSSRDIVSLAIDAATRLSKKSHTLQNSDAMTKHMRESEVVDWASVFKKRIVTFLRETT
ncbi:hypothetical protein vseg_016623 [Gypsophila vaccaria]